MTAEYVAALALAECTTLAEATPRILAAICQALDWEYGALWNVDREATLLRWVESWQRPPAEFPEFIRVSRGITFQAGVGLPGRVWQQGRPAWIPDVVRDPNFPRAPIAAREGLHGAFGFPILLKDETLGIMEFFSREVREPDEDLLRMLETVGRMIGQFMERRRAEEDRAVHAERLAQLVKELELANARAEDATRAESEFLAHMSHEIRTPLNAIVGMTELALQGRLTQEQREHLDAIRQSADSLLAIINDILDVSKIEARRLDLDHVDFGLRDTVEDTVRGLAPRAQEKGLELACHIDPDLPDAATPSTDDPVRLHFTVSDTGIRRARSRTPSGAASRSLRVLLAEDNDVDRRIVESILQKRGHSVFSVGNGREAVAALGRQTSPPFDLVIMDVQMPEMDGLEATAVIRHREKIDGGHVPILALTARAMSEDRQRCLDTGMDGFLAKPIHAGQLIDAVERCAGAPDPAGSVSEPAEDLPPHRLRQGSGPPSPRLRRGLADQPPPRLRRSAEASAKAEARRAEAGGPGPAQAGRPKRHAKAEGGSHSRTERDTTPVFSEATALAYTGSDRRLLREIVQLFLSNCPKQVNDLRRAVEGMEGPPVHRAAHALKGALATLGAERALALARRLETMGSTNQLAGARDACRAFEGELDALKRSLRALIEPRGSAKTERHESRPAPAGPHGSEKRPRTAQARQRRGATRETQHPRRRR